MPHVVRAFAEAEYQILRARESLSNRSEPSPQVGHRDPDIRVPFAIYHIHRRDSRCGAWRQ